MSKCFRPLIFRVFVPPYPKISSCSLVPFDFFLCSLVPQNPWETLKCRWIEKGEKPTKYFFNLEKRNYDRKTIHEIRSEDGEEIREEKEILKAIHAFYEDLYSSKTITSQEQFDLFVRNLNFPQLSDEDRDEIEGPLTLEECKTVLESFQETNRQVKMASP